MDRISTYRQIHLQLTVTREGFVGSVFTRVAANGRVRDKMVARQMVLPSDPITTIEEIGDLLYRAVIEFQAGNYTPPR